MPAKDRYHNEVVHALEKDGWTITNDPLSLALLGTDLMIDLGAERVLGAERSGQRIAVEIKSFIGKSAIQDLKEAAGQFVLYELALSRIPEEADRILYLAVRQDVYEALFEDRIGKILLDSNSLRLVVFDEGREEVTRWIP